MSRMVLGGYTMPDNPSSVSDLMTPKRHTAVVKTYSSIAFFSWGASMLGKQITLRWLGMTTDQYEYHQAQLENDTYMTFDPKDGSLQTYTVEMVDLRGEMHMETDGDYRVNVEMDLVFLSEGA